MLTKNKNKNAISRQREFMTGSYLSSLIEKECKLVPSAVSKKSNRDKYFIREIISVLKTYDNCFHELNKKTRIQIAGHHVSFELMRDSYQIELSKISGSIQQTTIDENPKLSYLLQKLLHIDSCTVESIQQRFCDLGIQLLNSSKRNKQVIEWNKARKIIIFLLLKQDKFSRKKLQSMKTRDESRILKTRNSSGVIHRLGNQNKRVVKNVKTTLRARSQNISSNNLLTKHYLLNDEEVKILSHNTEENGDVIYKVYYGTNRKYQKDSSKISFLDEKDDKIHYGLCSVKVPQKHQFGKIEKAWYEKLLSLDLDDSGKLSLKEIIPIDDENMYWNKINELFKVTTSAKKDVLLFIHGYNNSFEDAALRAAQLGFDLKISGVTAFFSWASKKKLLKYMSDEDAITLSENDIYHFIKKFAEQPEINQVHILAHSMGNRGLFRTLEKLKDDEDIKFGQIILAAPDLHADLFRANSDLYTKKAKRTTLYVSTDIPLSASKALHSNTRLGSSPPVTVVDDIDTIQVSQKLTRYLTSLGHTYFAEAESLLADIFILLQSDLAPGDRQRLKPMSSEGKSYWTLDE